MYFSLRTTGPGRKALPFKGPPALFILHIFITRPFQREQGFPISSEFGSLFYLSNNVFVSGATVVFRAACEDDVYYGGRQLRCYCCDEERVMGGAKGGGELFHQLHFPIMPSREE